MRKLEKLKSFLGLAKYSKYTQDYFDYSNIRSSLYVASVVVILEIWMIFSTLFFQYLGDLNRSKQWLVTHIGCYIVLFVAALLLLIYSLLHHKKLVKRRTIWWGLRFVFSLDRKAHV